MRSLCLHWGSSCWAPSQLFWCFYTALLTPQKQKDISGGELRHQSQFSTFIFCYGGVSNEKMVLCTISQAGASGFACAKSWFVSWEHSQGHGKPTVPSTAERQSTDVWMWCLVKFMVSRKCAWDLCTSAQICAVVQVVSTVGRARGHWIGKSRQQAD